MPIPPVERSTADTSLVGAVDEPRYDDMLLAQATWRTERSRLQTETQDLRRRVEALSTARAEAEIARTAADAARDQALAQLDSLTTELAAVRLEHRRAVTEAADLTLSLRYAREAREVAQTALAKLEALCAEITADRDHLRQSLQQATARAETLSDQLRALHSEVEQLSINNQFLTNKLRRRDEA